MLRSRFPRSELLVLALLAAVQFSHIVDFMIIMPLGPQLMRIMQIKPEQFSLLVSAYTFCAGATGLMSAFFLDRFDRKRSMLFFFGGFGLGTLACGMASSYETLLAARAFTGAFGGILGSLVMAIVGDVISPERRGEAMGVVMGAFSLASIFGVPFSLFLAAHGSWQTPLYALAGLSALVGGLLMLWLPPMREHIHDRSGSAWSFIRRVPFEKRPRTAILLMSTMVLGHFSVIPFISPSLVANAGMSEAQLPLIYLVGGAASMLSSPYFGLWSDRYGPMRVLFYSASFSIIPLLLVSHLPKVHLSLALMTCALFFVCIGGRMVPTMTLVTGSVHPKHRGAYMSLSNSLQQFSAASGAWIAGHIVVRSADGHLDRYPWVGYLSVALTLLALALAYTLRHEPAQIRD